MPYDHIQRGQYLIGDKEYYFRSKWEANYALYLHWLVQQGAIKSWVYESKWFDFPVKHGTTRYLPDFEVTENNGSLTYYEVKGYLTSRAKTQLKRMAKHHPKVKLVLIDSGQMREVMKLKGVIKFY